MHSVDDRCTLGGIRIDCYIHWLGNCGPFPVLLGAGSVSFVCIGMGADRIGMAIVA